MEDLYINPRITIPSDCFDVSSSRSSGPGGQHVNKLNTRITVFLDIPSCRCFSESQKNTLFSVLKSRIDKQGVLQVSSQRYRSQRANREDALDRMAELIAAAIRPKPKRKKTKIPQKSIKKRLEDKKARSYIKQIRSSGVEIE